MSYNVAYVTIVISYLLYGNVRPPGYRTASTDRIPSLHQRAWWGWIHSVAKTLTLKLYLKKNY